MPGEAAAREYFGGLARIGLPSLTIAHVRGYSLIGPNRDWGRRPRAEVIPMEPRPPG